MPGQPPARVGSHIRLAVLALELVLSEGWWPGGIFVATIYPSWSAARILPAEALRYE